MADIFAACKQGDIDRVRDLILGGTSVNITDTDGRSLLFYACLHNHEEIVQCLIKQGSNVNLQEHKHGWSALYVAAYKDRMAIAQLLINYGVDINAKSQPRILNGESDDVMKSGTSSNISNISYETALHAAAKKGHISMAKLLLENGANPNANAELKVTPLHLACFKDHVKMTEIMFTYGADPNIPIFDGSTPLIWACQGNKIHMVGLLLQNGANVETATEDNATPLYIASQHGFAEICSLLLRKGANVEVKYQNINDTPLTIAAYKNHLETIQVLVNAGAKLHSTDSNANTALHLACSQGHQDIVYYLLQKDVQFTKNKFGETAIDIIKERNEDDELVEVLKNHRRKMKQRKYKEACLVEENKNFESLVKNLKSEVRALERHEIPYSADLIQETLNKVKLLENEVKVMKVKVEGDNNTDARQNAKVIDSNGFFHKAAEVNQFIIAQFQKEAAKGSKYS